MVANALVDAGFLVALLSRRDNHNQWAITQAAEHVFPWRTCEAALSEAFHLLGRRGATALASLLRRGAVATAFDLAAHQDPVLALMEKYATVPMSMADACLVRMTEISANSVVLTTDSDFRVYRRHSRHVIPCVMP
jgi:predicted nucleic acid-binding protein